MKADLLGRLNYDPDGGGGHSVCYSCGLDMPKVWDIVCSDCNHTFCYKCSKSTLTNWYCIDCYVKRYRSLMRKIFLIIARLF